MNYTYSDDQINEFYKSYDVSLTKEEVVAQTEDICAFLAVQSGLDYSNINPEQNMRERYGMRLDEDVATCIANQIADRIIANEELKATLEPNVEGIEEFHWKEAWNFTVNIPVKPQLELSSYDDVEIRIKDFCIDEQFIDDYIEREMQDRAVYDPDPDAQEVHSDSDVIISVETDKLGMQVGPLCAKNAPYTIGEEVLPPIFDEKLLDMKPGDTIEFEYDIVSKNFLGLDVNEHMHSVMTLHHILKKTVPTLSDEWVKKNVAGATDIESWRELVRMNMQYHGEQQRTQMTEAKAMEALAARLPEYEFPAEYIEYSRAGLLQNVSAAFNKSGMTEEEFYAHQGISKEQFMMDMWNRGHQILREGLALEALARHYDLVPEDIDYAVALERIDSGHTQDVRKMLEMNGRLYQLTEMATRIKARKYLIEHTKVEYYMEGRTTI